MRAARQNGEPLLEPLEQGARGQRPDPGGCELDRERQAVDAPADLADNPLVLGRDVEVGLQRPSPLFEELDGGIVVERRDGKDVLAGQVQNGTARDQEHESRGAGEQLDERRRRGAQMLDVVEDDEELPVAHCRSERVERSLAGHLRDPDCARDRRQEQPRVAQGRELDDHSAVGEARRRLPGGREREARLAAPSCAGEDEQSRVATREELGQRLQIALASDQRVRRYGQRARGVDGRNARVELGILLENAALQLTELRARLQPELVIEAAPELDVVVECLGLPAGPVERQHREALQALPQRMVSCHRERITEHLVVPAEP